MFHSVCKKNSHKIISYYYFSGQQLAAQMESENPALVDQLRRQLGESHQPPPPPDTKKNE